MKNFILILTLIAGVIPTINAMDRQPLPYYSTSIINERTRRIANPEHKETIMQFMHMCAWVPEAETITYLGNSQTNGGYYDPLELYELLKEIIPAMIRARTEFVDSRDIEASRTLGLFAVQMAQSFLALKKAAGITKTSNTEIMIQDKFHLH